MSWLKGFATSTVGRKYLVGVTGLFLCFFLVVHLGGNLLLYVGADAYNTYAEQLHSNHELLIAIEIVLYAAFAIHISVSLWLQVDNWRAREHRYALVQSKRGDRVLHPAIPASDRTMLITGIIVLAFILVHLSDFKIEFGWTEALEGESRYAKARIIVANVLHGAVYLAGSLVLGVHVTHGFQSAFQSLGWNHPRYTPGIRRLSVLFGLAVALGFGSFPLMAWMQSWGS